MKSIDRQNGVALITAMMIVALATVVSVGISTELQLDIRRTSNIITSDQAKLYASAAEELAKRYLLIDLKDNDIDHLEEAWAQDYLFPLEEGTLQARLTDIQACININTLVKGDEVNEVAKNRIDQLFTNAGLPTGLSQSIIDWIDKGVEITIPDGAEDGYYTALDKPYRTANTYLQSLSELNLIKGFEDQKTITALADDICAFGDVASSVPINVNTASLEVLLSLSSSMTTSTAEDIIQHRIETPFTDISNFKSFADLETIIPIMTGLSFSTNFFMLETNIVIGDARVTMFSVIHRKNTDEINIISRSQGVF